MNKTELPAWILGEWKLENPDGLTMESWHKINDDLFEGYSETVSNGTQTFSEKLSIRKINNDIYYIADVSHNPAPVRFLMIVCEEGKAVFENKEHDFPQLITYKLEDGNLHAFIEGTGKNGVLAKIDFFMNKYN